MKNYSNLLARRRQLAASLHLPVLLFAGDRLSRNFRANKYPFRASSHFLYFAGAPLAGAVLFLDGDRQIIFFDLPTSDDALWHGEFMGVEALQSKFAVDEILPKSALSKYVQGAATIPLTDPFQRLEQSQALKRPLTAPNQLSGGDRQLAEAIINLRLQHDDGAIAEIKKAINVSIEAHQRGMKTAQKMQTETSVRAAIEGHFLEEQMPCAYHSIVSTAGEVLHNESSPNDLKAGDLLLVDAGAETSCGWASDLTRTYPISGKFSPTQRDIYKIVLEAHDQAITALKPTAEFRDIHRLATKIITEGLLDLGILQGKLDDLITENITATFFPHGLGHLLGLDVHDMEDLGDLAGYAPNRQRSEQFGECFLRLNRPLRENMVVTIEPGFYQVPAILGDRRTQKPFKSMINWEKLEQFQDVRGIRIEDDIQITANGAINLSQALITSVDDLENFMNP
ncbi:Xaa-Pro aminopeptidase [[Leptolyngbya] sp. PCC 7376]|uniref:aminopeptidase P family protein n=1 Tax=[Leptolyngbya] sp. PCC 7376 TaxID=111781 RepID=UPI00029ED466|nr:aminopeptidase P family protein [[Leptolyngbya] sp. PCC 7376]AFY40554.1 Xaa-Pro aminopeptidase [[Leptolyngbya] sp. PCC 7376]